MSVRGLDGAHTRLIHGWGKSPGGNGWVTSTARTARAVASLNRRGPADAERCTENTALAIESSSIISARDLSPAMSLAIDVPAGATAELAKLSLEG